MTPYLVLTACAAFGLLVRAQEVAPASISSSARRSCRLADRLQPTGHPSARRTHGRNDLAMPQSHAVGCRCRPGMIRDLTSHERSTLSTSSRSLELLRRAGPGRGPHAQLVSLAAQAVRAHAERCRAPLVYGSRERWSGTDFAELPGSPQSYTGGKQCISDVYTTHLKYLAGEI